MGESPSRKRLRKGSRRGVAAGIALTAGMIATATVTVPQSAGANTRHVGTSHASKPSGSIAYAWWGSPGRTALTDNVINLFEKFYPNVSVTEEPTGNYTNYWQQLTVEGAAHNIPCVPTTQTTYLADYDRNGDLLPLNNLIKRGLINIKGIPNSIIQGGTYNGKIYMIGYGAASNAIVYNVAMAKKFHIPLLKQAMKNVTWQDFQNWLLSAQKKLPSGLKAIDASSEWSQQLTFAWVTGQGEKPYKKHGKGYELGFSKQTLIDYWKWWQKLINAGATTSPAVAAEEPTTSGDDYLAQGQVLSADDTANLLADQTTLDGNHKGLVEDVNFPTGPSGANGQAFDVSGLSISSNCKDIPAAAAFVNFWINNPHASDIYDSNNGAVTVTSLLDRQLRSSKNLPAVKSSLRYFKLMFSENDPVAFNPPGYGAVVSDLETITQAVQFKKESMQAAANQFFSEADHTLQQG